MSTIKSAIVVEPNDFAMSPGTMRNRKPCVFVGYVLRTVTRINSPPERLKLVCPINPTDFRSSYFVQFDSIPQSTPAVT